jgi:hypothetical protein
MVGAERHQKQIDGIEHHLNTHKEYDDIATHQNAHRADAEKDCTKVQIMFYRNARW